MNEIKNYAKSAAASSLVVVSFLTTSVHDAGKAAEGNVRFIIKDIAILVIAYCAIMLWIKCVKKYVHFVIEQKMGNIVTEK